MTHIFRCMTMVAIRAVSYMNATLKVLDVQFWRMKANIFLDTQMYLESIQNRLVLPQEVPSYQSTQWLRPWQWRASSCNRMRRRSRMFLLPSVESWGVARIRPRGENWFFFQDTDPHFVYGLGKKDRKDVTAFDLDCNAFENSINVDRALIWTFLRGIYCLLIIDSH